MAYRLLEGGVGPIDPEWRVMLSWLAAASLVIGNLIALAQTNFKRLLAYSTISHVGFVFMGIAAANAAGYAAAMFYVLSYAIMATASFGAIVVLARNGYEADGIDDFRGLAARSPWLAGMMLCAMMSLAGIPPFLGFWAKLAVLRATIQGDMMWLAIVGIVFAVIGCFYYLRVLKAMYFDPPPEGVEVPIPHVVAGGPFRVRPPVRVGNRIGPGKEGRPGDGEGNHLRSVVPSAHGCDHLGDPSGADRLERRAIRPAGLTVPAPAHVPVAPGA